MDKIDTEIRFADMAEERLRREDPHYRVWSFTDDDDVTGLAAQAPSFKAGVSRYFFD